MSARQPTMPFPARLPTDLKVDPVLSLIVLTLLLGLVPGPFIEVAKASLLPLP